MIENSFGLALLTAFISLSALGIFEFRRKGHLRTTIILLLIFGVIFLIWLVIENPECFIGLIIIAAINAINAMIWVMLKRARV